MPRRPSATVDSETTTAPSANGTAEHDLEELPSFDERGVRPSEQCGTPAPPGAHYGARCEFRDEHTGRHSWQPDEPDADELDQAELPGTPAAEADDYSVPFEAQFNNRDLLDSAGLRSIGERLINSATDADGFDHLRGIEIHWFWKRRGGTQGGNPRYAGIKRPGSFEKHYTGSRVIYLVWLAADHVREARFTPEQIEACLYDQLTRTDVDPEDHDAYRIVGPDFVGSIRTLRRYGVWNADLREAAAHIQQLPLVQLEEDGDEADDGADADEDEDEAES